MNTATATYDPAGNQQTAGGFGFSWDAENRLTQSTINGYATNYTYKGNAGQTRR